MWLKSLNVIKNYVPDDGIYHNIQIIGEFIYVDGNCQNPYVKVFEGEIKDGEFHEYAMTAEEIKKKYADNQSLHVDRQGRAAEKTEP